MTDVLYPVECPYCLASPGNRCRTLGTRRVTDYHEARREKWFIRNALATRDAARRSDRRER